MSLLPRSSFAVTRSLVRSTLDERVTLYAPGVEGQGDFGEGTPGTPREVATVGAHVLPVSADERIETDRPTGAAQYRVRVDLSDVGEAPETSWTALWLRSDARGGPMALTVVAPPSDRRGRFVDLLCEERSPAGVPVQ